jgi:Helix-turn-helix.
MSASAFAEKVGVQPSSISHILSGRNKPSLEFIQKVLIQFPKVNADWLISGKNNTEEFTTNPEKIVPQKNSIPTPQNSSKQIKKIVLFYTDNTFEEVLNLKD